MQRLELTPEELDAIDDLIATVLSGHDSVEADDFLAEAPILAHVLPTRVREFLNRLRFEEFSAGVISGHRIDDQLIGATPAHWNTQPVPSPALAQEVLAILYGSLLGDVFAWATQQDGRLVHDVLPIRGFEHEQLGCSSEVVLSWHTEDAFHPLRGDYLILLCLRNPDDAPTTIGSIEQVKLDPGFLDVLFQPRFLIRPDDSHLPKHNAQGTPERFREIEQMKERPEPLAALFGDPKRPYLRLDPYYMNAVPGDTTAATALAALVKAVDDHLTDVVLRPGDVCILDNYRVVHGRKPFAARFDGTDRWLKRVNVTRDLRKSCSVRSVRSRVIR